eukprot:scaffold46862_cov50-Phaeocystis_antarctica.AAC.2
MRASGACSACTSPIFVQCASPPGTAYAPLRALLCPARAPRGSTRGPRGAGDPNGPWGSTLILELLEESSLRSNVLDALFSSHIGASDAHLIVHRFGSVEADEADELASGFLASSEDEG